MVSGAWNPSGALDERRLAEAQSIAVARAKTHPRAMFGLFKKAPPASVVGAEGDLVYRDDAVRTDAVAQQLRALGTTGVSLAVLSPFRDHTAWLREGLAARGLSLVSLDGSYRDAAPAAGAIYLLECARVPELLARTNGKLRCVQVERHPLRAHDDAVDTALAAHSIGHRVRRYLALTDGLFVTMDSSGNLRSMLDSLGLEPTEAIEHPLVMKSIARAQEKIAKKVRSEVPASSFAEWRKANLAG